MAFYLIKRGPRSEFHRAPFHPVIICNRSGMAKWEAKDTSEKAMIWVKDQADSGGFLLARWNGLDIDYGGLIHDVGPMPDGMKVGFYHDRDAEPWTLLRGAIWWSSRKMPKWFMEQGVEYPPDDFSQQRILDNEHWLRKDCEGSGWDKEVPEWWARAK